MRFSEIIGEGFYNIRLTRKHSALLDAHYLGAAHHLHRCMQAMEQSNNTLIQFHGGRMKAHLCALLQLVQGGDFSQSSDPTERGFDRPEAWEPERILDNYDPQNPPAITSFLPDPDCFDDLTADRRFVLGEDHLYDELFDHPELVHRLENSLTMFRRQLT